MTFKKQTNSFRGNSAVLLPHLRDVGFPLPGADGLPGEVPGPAEPRQAAGADVRRPAEARLARPRPSTPARPTHTGRAHCGGGPPTQVGPTNEAGRTTCSGRHPY